MIKSIVLLIAISISLMAKAEDFAKTEDLDPWFGFALIEGIFVANSLIAAESPEGLGWGLTVLSPFALASEGLPLQTILGATAIAAIGQYNVQELSDEEQYSKSDIFKNNMYAFHAVGAIALLSEWLTGDTKAVEHVALMPSSKGFILAFNYDL